MLLLFYHGHLTCNQQGYHQFCYALRQKEWNVFVPFKVSLSDSGSFRSFIFFLLFFRDLLYQYDLISWQQYRSIESSSDDKDASSHLLYALRDGPPDAVGTFIDLLSKVPGQDGLAYMLQQDLLSLSRNHATAESTGMFPYRTIV